MAPPRVLWRFAVMKAGPDQQHEKQGAVASVSGSFAGLFGAAKYDIALAVAQLPFPLRVSAMYDHLEHENGPYQCCSDRALSQINLGRFLCYN